METIGTVTNAYRDGGDVVLTVVRNPESSYRLWKETMDSLERTIEEFEEDMKCHYCGNERANFEAHLKRVENGWIVWEPVYFCGPCMNRFVIRDMHEQRKS